MLQNTLGQGGALLQHKWDSAGAEDSRRNSLPVLLRKAAHLPVKQAQDRQGWAGLPSSPCSSFSLLPAWLPLVPSSLPLRPIRHGPGCHPGPGSSLSTVKAKQAISDPRSALKAFWKVLVGSCQIAPGEALIHSK